MMDPVIDQKDIGVEGRLPVEPDVMNDHAYDFNNKNQQSNLEEPDTCRICRGEGSQEEPLFYPCKCSGSIKFVHQNCLMEWLSHSQKKHCELCKTHFHFTKLYHPHMPSTVPLPIFLRQAAVHTWKSMVMSSRFFLVMLVWAAWLPWCMRNIWRGLFWIGDGAWVDWSQRRLLNGSVTYDMSAHLAMEGTTPVKQGLLTSQEAAASAFITQISNKLPHFSYSTGRPLSLVLFRKLWSYFSWQTPGPPSASVPSSLNNTRQEEVDLHSSWLSEFQFMKTLTPSTMVNNLLIDTLEGQLITLFVVTAFILIFLIREWVVQQQPILNIGINLNAEGPIAPHAEAPAPQEPADQRRDVLRDGLAAAPADEVAQVQGPGARMIARARPRRPTDLRRQQEQGGIPIEDGHTGGDGLTSANGEPSHISQAMESANNPSLPAGQPHRPAMPDRGTLAKAAEIRRTIEEHSRSSISHDSDMEVFIDLWNRAGQDPSQAIKIIEEEGLSDKLGWIVTALQKIEGPRQEAEADQQEESTKEVVESRLRTNSDQPEDEEGFIFLNRASSNSSSEPSPAHDQPESSSGSGKKLISPSPAQLQHSNPMDDDFQAQFLHAEPNSTLGKLPVKAEVLEPSSSNPEVHSPGSPSGQLDSIKSDAPKQPAGPASDNPFHPNYEGELPESSLATQVASLDEGSSHPSDGNPPEVNATQLTTNQAHNSAVRGLAEPTKSVMETVTDWLWGGVTPLPLPQEQPAGHDDEHVVRNIAEEAPFVPVDQGQPLRLAANDRAVANQDPNVVAAAIQAGIDPNEAEVVDEIEDLEGILELVGMQGPLAGLVQNGMFCACLVSLSIFFGVWIPYMSGKIFLVLLAHPFSLLFKIPLRWAASSADTIIDLFTFCAGCAFYWTDTVVSVLCAPLGLLVPPLARLSQNKMLAEIAKSYAEAALRRLAKSFVATGGVLSETDIPIFSVLAHESLGSIRTRITWLIQGAANQVADVFNMVCHSSSVAEFSKLVVSGVTNHAKAFATLAVEKTAYAASLWPTLVHINPLQVNLNSAPRTQPLDYDLAHWNTKDRILAVMFGYLFFALLGVIYLHLGSRMKGTNKNGRVIGGLADSLYQAGGVMKVILIISIEMIVFPLYCGLLLDVALLPLFDNVTIISRINFTLASPNTSLFIHWFVGTCYMFHFALFVSMCRKILRSGVLYFIRDPDDPTFHPVRDVLERSVSTQLWKISFSALVYGGLVIVCLGGVVWGIAYTCDGVLPIHWSSNEPVLEFPVDLLFYNILMPLAVKFFKPSKGLNKIFTWWFRKCARALRLTNFLFGEEKHDEEASHVHRTGTDFFKWSGTLAESTSAKENQQRPALEGVEDSPVQRNGRYVRAPGSDQVRIPKGANTFLEVDEDNNRSDGQPDFDDGLHGRKNKMFTKVYIPPIFRLRISAFVFLIWLFAAATGISLTIVPLVFGRFVFAVVAPNHLRMNDIYAFSVGIYILGGALYGVLQHRHIANYVRATLTPHATTITSFLRKSATVTIRSLSLVYIYTAFGILLPALLSILMEFYFIIPIHTYFSTTFASLEVIQSERHIIHLIQDWTLGVLYLKMAARLILWHTPSRPATALRAIVRNGWLDPDIMLATRGFIVPAILAMSFALAAPLFLGWLANITILHPYSAKNELFKACVYRYSYPGILALGFAAASVWLLAKAFGGWRKKVRDEVYLIGERLHNFGETKRRRGSGKGKGKAVAAGPAEPA